MKRMYLHFFPNFSFKIEDVQHFPHPLIRIFSVTLALKQIYLKKKKNQAYFPNYKTDCLFSWKLTRYLSKLQNNSWLAHVF